MSTLLTDEQRAAYVRPECPLCRSNEQVTVEWELLRFASGEEYWTPMRHDCRCRQVAAEQIDELAPVKLISSRRAEARAILP